MKTGIELISEEREKQIKKHGFTAEHHANHPEWYDKDQLILAARYLSAPKISSDSWCPKNWDSDWFNDLCRRPLKERIKISAALLAAELDRIIFLNSEN